MQIVIASVAFFCAALCAGLMGYAIQRGATCTVAAVDEIVSEHSFRRLLSLFEAALWVAGGLIVAQALHPLPKLPVGYAVSAWTVIGGTLLGLGAFVNGACVFGAIARFGSGEWAYIVTPIGFFVGCLTVALPFAMPMPHALDRGSPVLQAPAWVALLFVAFALWRIVRPWLGAGGRSISQRWHEAIARRVWSPHAATVIIGLTFAAMLLLVGGWTYTDVLAELARGMSASVGARGLLALALLLGAAFGGWTAGRFRSTRISVPQLLRCFAGGVLMGWGSLLLPGGNDVVILVGMPLAWPYAWIAFLTMGVTVAAAQMLWRSLARSLDKSVA
jgi:toxin CptA